jgi:uncharacterized protein (DUF488 family)
MINAGQHSGRRAGAFLTIGHSNLPLERFAARLRGAGADAVADVRSRPQSRWCPWFSARPLAASLEREGGPYVWLGAQLGGRPSEPHLYRDGVVDYEAVAATASFRSGLDALIEAGARHGRICLMCTERAPARPSSPRRTGAGLAWWRRVYRCPRLDS